MGLGNCPAESCLFNSTIVIYRKSAISTPYLFWGLALKKKMMLIFGCAGCWISVSARALLGSRQAGAPPQLLCMVFSLLRLLALRSTRSRARGLQQLWCIDLVAPQHVESSQIRDQTHVSCIGRWMLHPWANSKAPLLFSFSVLIFLRVGWTVWGRSVRFECLLCWGSGVETPLQVSFWLSLPECILTSLSW